MSPSADPHDRISPDDALPPVEPPSAGFIVQLFVIPAVIVVIIVVVWGLFNWLAQMGNDPSSFVDALKRNNEARWQAAVNLADALRDPHNVALKQDVKVANDLASILQTELAEGRIDENSLKLRVYLCNALGEFTVPEVVPALLQAATTQKSSDEKYVRFAALKALAVFVEAQKVKAKTYPRFADAEVMDVFLKASHDDEPVIRSTSAFGLGAIGNDKSLDRLKQMVNDPYPDVRFNAATMLARSGNDAAVPVLVEMLDPDELAGVEAEKESGSREYKRATIIINALRAASDLAKVNPKASVGPLLDAVNKLPRDKLPEQLKIQASETARDLEKIATGATKS
jgi:hypothetical protein